MIHHAHAACVATLTIAAAGLFAQPPKDTLPDGAIARLGSSLWRGLVDRYGSAHFEFTADGKSVVFLSPERTVVWLDVETGRVTKRVRGPAPFGDFVLTPDAGTLVTADEPKPVTMAFVPPGPSDPRGLRAWDVAGTPKPGWFLENQTGGLVGDARHVVVFGDHKLSLVDVRTGKPVWSNPLDDKARSTMTHVLSADGKSVVAVAAGDQVHPAFAWDVATGERRTLTDLTVPHSGIALSADGSTAASFGHEKVVRRWDLRSGKEFPALVGHEVGAVHAATLSRDGRAVVSSGIDRTVRWWDGATGKELGRIKTPRPAGHLRLSPDGKTLAAIYSGENVLRRFDLTTRGELPTPDGHAAEVTFLAFTGDGKALVSAADDNAVTVWDPATGAVRRRFPARTFDQFLAAAISPDGRLLASANALDGDPVRLWDLSTGEAVRELARAKGAVRAVAFAPDGRTLAVWRSGWEAPGPSLRVWDLAGRELWKADAPVLGGGPGEAGRWLQFTADGARLWAATHPGPTAWDAVTGRRVAGAADPLSVISVSPDGRMVAGRAQTNAGATEVRVIESASGQVRSRFGRGPAAGPIDPAVPVVFSPDGRRLAAADGSAVVLWDIGAGKVLRRLAGHVRGVRALAFSPDGKVLASGSDDSTIVLWDVSSRPPAPK
jgi:WD40 repeat protein